MLETLKIPSVAEAERLLAEAADANPGPWVMHSRYVAQAAQVIARDAALDGDAAYVLGCLHDIGRRAGVTGTRHILDGYRYLLALGYDDAARICLTHSFPLQHVEAIYGQADWSAEDGQFVADTLAGIEYTDYDRLIQLCDSLALPTGFCLIEKRFVDVVLRYGSNDYTVPKWQATLAIKDQFEKIIGGSIYNLLPGVVATTFGPSFDLSAWGARPQNKDRGVNMKDDAGALRRVFIGGVMQASNTGKDLLDQGYRSEIAAALQARWPDTQIIDPLLLHPNSPEYDDSAARKTLFAMAELAARSDLVIVYLPVASMGTALEMYMAHQAGVPVVAISPMLTNWVVRALATRLFPDMETFHEALARSDDLTELAGLRPATSPGLAG